MDYELIEPDGETEDKVLVGGVPYRIRFRPRHAQHVMDNYPEPNHRIKHWEILTLIRHSIYVPGRFTGTCVGRHRNKIYMTVVVLEQGEMLIRTCFLCNQERLRQLFKQHEAL